MSTIRSEGDSWDLASDVGATATTVAAARALATRQGLYLPPDAQDRLFDHITALSPAASRLATEFIPNMAGFAGDGTDDHWQRFGFKDDLADLVYAGERSPVVEYLTELGWRVTASLVRELFERYGIERHHDEMTERFGDVHYVSAIQS